MRTKSRYLLAVLLASLRKPSIQQRGQFRKVISCTRALLDFIMCCQLDVQTTLSLDMMDLFLQKFHEGKEIFLEFRAGKRVTEEAKLQNSERIRARTEHLAQFSKAHEGTESQKYNHETQEQAEKVLRDGAHFNFLKLHMLTHSRSQIERFGCLEM